MSKPRVLICSERWKSGAPGGALTNSAHNLWGSMEASGLVEGSVFCLDEYFHKHNKPCDEKLIEMASRFDLVLVCLLPQGFPSNPRPTTLAEVAQRTRLAVLWPDAALMSHERVARYLEPITVRTILWDVDFGWEAGRKFLHLWTPQDPRIFFDAGVKRDIDVSFCGSIAYPERREVLTGLSARGLQVHVCGGRHNDDAFSPQDYARVMQRSKISLNFCGTPFGREQLKGRVFEVTSCGALLMESVGRDNWIERWFMPGRDYVSFVSVDDLAEKIKRYLADEAGRERIAGNGHRLATQDYSARAWWAYLLEECGLNALYLPLTGKAREQEAIDAGLVAGAHAELDRLIIEEAGRKEKFIAQPALPYKRLGRRLK